MKFTADQEKAFELIMSGMNVFVTGGGGVGKTHLLRTVINACRHKHRKVMVCAPTGSAAVLIQGATIHRAFDIPSGCTINEKTMKIMTRTTPSLYKADMIIIDEISMCRMDLFDAVANSLAKVEAKTGRKVQLVVFGDFLQLPPVLTTLHGEKMLMDKYYGFDVGQAYAFQAKSWSSFHFIPVIMNEVVRQSNRDFILNLEKARIGDKSCIGFFNKNSAYHQSLSAIYLTAYKEDAERINNEEMRKNGNPEVAYDMLIDGVVDKTDMIVPQHLVLKKGCLVTTVVNHPDNDYVNGSIGTVVDFRDGAVIVDFNGRNIDVEPHEWDVYDYKALQDGRIKKECIGSYVQFPLRIAYASTIHKAQGATYDEVTLNPKCWGTGQLYVALSRIKSLNHMYLIRDIQQSDLIADSTVLSFYQKLEADAAVASVTKAKGRPRNSTGKPETIRVPADIKDEIQYLIKQWNDLGGDRYNHQFAIASIDTAEKIEYLSRMRKYLGDKETDITFVDLPEAILYGKK